MFFFSLITVEGRRSGTRPAVSTGMKAENEHCVSTGWLKEVRVISRGAEKTITGGEQCSGLILR